MISYYYASKFSLQLYSSHAYTDRISINYSPYISYARVYIYIYLCSENYMYQDINFHLLCSCGWIYKKLP